MNNYIPNDYQSTLIGMLAVKPNLFNISILRKEYFIQKEYQSIFAAMENCHKEDNMIINDKLALNKSVDFNLYLECISSNVTTNIEEFKRLQEYAIEKWKQNVICFKANQLQQDLISLDEYNSYVNKVNKISVIKTNKVTAQKLMDSITGEKKKQIHFRKFKKFGKLLRLQESDFMIIAGGTSIGKSAFALNILEDLSYDYQCKYYNLEMPEEDLNQRLLSMTSQVAICRLEEYKILDNDLKNQIHTAANEFGAKNIDVFSGSISIEQIRSDIAMYQGDKHLIVFVDHIGLIKTKGNNLYEKATELAKELRRISLEYNCTIVGLSQLNRDSVKKANKPNLAMLRDSGELEQSASKVVFIWKEEDEYSWVIEKNRSGQKGIVDIKYYKALQRMEEKQDA